VKEYSIVTVCNRRPTESYYCLDEFIKSLDNEPITVIGTQPKEYGGLGSKPRLLFHAIKNNAFDSKYLVFCDCFDLVFATSVEHLVRKYKEFNAPVVISAEKNCFPADLKDQFDERHKGSSPYKYLNSGMIVGEIDAILAILQSMDAPNIPNDYWDGGKMINPNDQEYYQREYLKQPVEIVLDTEQILCNTLHQVELDELDFSEEKIANKITRSYPCSFHLNGGAKTGPCREPILKHLNLI
jgi:hypothetical protein